MKVFYHFAASSFSNVYVIGPEEPGEAIVVDPSIFDSRILRLVESNGYYVASVLVTHGHESHVRGLKTLLKIYRARVYAAAPEVADEPCTRVAGGDRLRLGSLDVEVIEVQGHTRDSVMYRVGDLMFTGDALSAGKLGRTANPYGQALLAARVGEILSGSKPHTILLPGHGPPSTAGAELELNPEIRHRSGGSA